MPFIVVDNASLRVVCKVRTKEQAEYMGDLAVPSTNDFSIRGLEARDFTPYKHEELTQLYENTFSRRLSDATPYNRTIKEIREMLADWDTEDRPIEDLKAEMKRRFNRDTPLGWVPPTPTQVKAMRGRAGDAKGELLQRKEKRERKESGPASRPKPGTATGQVWEIADGVKDAHPELEGKALRIKVIEAATAAGINRGTAQVQAGKWAKAQPTQEKKDD